MTKQENDFKKSPSRSYASLLQKELLEKVKEGVKPSDLKKPKTKPDQVDQSIPTPPITPNQQIKDLQSQISSLQKQLQTYKDFKEADLKIKEKYKKEIEQLKKQNQDLDYLITSGRSELRKEINKLQAENKNLNKTIQDLQKQATNRPKSPILNQAETKEEQPTKTFFCDSCQLTKTDILTKRKADCPLEPRLHGRTVYLCSSCSPYVKELSEPNFDKDNNPYKLN